MSCVQKHDVMNTKNLHIVTRQGTKIGNDNPHISKIKENNDYPNLTKKQQNYITTHQTCLNNLLGRKHSMTVDKTQLKN